MIRSLNHEDFSNDTDLLELIQTYHDLLAYIQKRLTVNTPREVADLGNMGYQYTYFLKKRINLLDNISPSWMTFKRIFRGFGKYILDQQQLDRYENTLLKIETKIEELMKHPQSIPALKSILNIQDFKAKQYDKRLSNLSTNTQVSTQKVLNFYKQIQTKSKNFENYFKATANSNIYKPEVVLLSKVKNLISNTEFESFPFSEDEKKRLRSAAMLNLPITLEQLTPNVLEFLESYDA